MEKESDTNHFRNLKVHDCSDCAYECFNEYCKYHQDDIYNLYENMLRHDKVFLIVPMYCGNPSSLYFKFNERSQDFFMHNKACYEDIISKLFIVGVYGDEEKNSNFIPYFEKWFECTQYKNHVLGIERHKYGQKISDKILDVSTVKSVLMKFINQ